jgi:hypothetical protein
MQPYFVYRRPGPRGRALWSVLVDDDNDYDDDDDDDDVHNTRTHARRPRRARTTERASPPTFAGGDRAASQPRCRRASSSLAVLGYSFSGRVRSAFRPARNWCDCPWGSKANGCHGWSNWHGSTGRAMYVRMCVCSLARAMSTEHRGGSSPSDEKWWRRGRRYDSTSYAYYHCY